jgi:hypothetical protein
VEEPDEAASWSLYPNPAGDEVQVQTAVPMARLRVFDMRGRLVLERRSLSTQERLPVAQWAPGVYGVQWEDASGRSSELRKLVVY